MQFMLNMSFPIGTAYRWMPTGTKGAVNSNKSKKEMKPITQPAVVNVYCDKMHGVDTSGQLLSSRFKARH